MLGSASEVQETPHLRALHERLNAELASQFMRTDALFDGAAYHFHATVALVEGAARYCHVLEDFRGRRVDITYRPEQIAMFYYDDDVFTPGTYLTYKVLPLKQA
jgi:2'-5' RNA ligase